MDQKRKKKITRREFLKKAGYTAGAIGISSTLPQLVKPARAASRDHILLGRVHPGTGPMAAFTEASPWVDNRALDEINREGGIYIKEYGKKLPLKVKFMDTQSDATKTAEVASRLAIRDKVDMMYASHAPANVNPVAAACERYKIPCIATVDPIEMFLAGAPYHWSFDAMCRVAGMMAAYLDMWSQIKTNRVVGVLASSEIDGIAFVEGVHQAVEPAGYKLIDTGRFPEGMMDFGVHINGWKKANVEILFGNLNPPDFSNAWRQCFREGFIPKICCIGRALLFPSAVEALGADIGLGTTTEAWWHSSYPFKSSLAGYTAKDLCDAYEAVSNKPWTQPLGHTYLGYEIIADVFKRAKAVDKETVRNAIAATDLDTIAGHVKFIEGNISPLPVGGVQWVKGKRFPFDSKLVSNGKWKILPTQGRMASIQELRGMS